MIRLMVVRAEPGASETVARAATLGLEALKAPIFDVKALDWEAPDRKLFDAILLTSAHSARLAGEGLRGFTALVCYAVGEATAEAARHAGFGEIRIGTGDGAALAALAEREGVRAALHLCGRDYRPLERPGLRVTRRIVYAADPIASLPATALQALSHDAVVLLHSPRAAAHFAHLIDAAAMPRADIRIAAISSAAALDAGRGWMQKAVAARPRDEALLELAAKLCKAGGGVATG
jgi:uroporphyrinogen-III synthase